MVSYINTDLTLHNIVTSYQPKNNIETTLKCLLAENSTYFGLKIVLLLTKLSNFERETALTVSAF